MINNQFIKTIIFITYSNYICMKLDIKNDLFVYHKIILIIITMIFIKCYMLSIN